MAQNVLKAYFSFARYTQQKRAAT